MVRCGDFFVLGRADSPQDICARFIALALDRKEQDNVTVVLARCLP